ncbi:MAG TPA: endonuclease/exonuclease/phosphatase family protein, partial [Blastocatellia bacterium]
MKLGTWNVNSITARLPVVLRWLEGARPDVLCLQETKCTDERFPVDAFLEL